MGFLRYLLASVIFVVLVSRKAMAKLKQAGVDSLQDVEAVGEVDEAAVVDIEVVARRPVRE
jgi:hypothetical protein